MKAAKIAAGIVLVVIVGVVIALSVIDVNQYRGVIQEQAKAATGRDVSVGEIELAISLSPAIVVHDVSVGNAPWGSRPEMVTAERIAAHTQLIPLIFGSVNISNLEIIGGDVLLETNADGRGNWEFDVEPTPSEESAGSEEAAPLNIDGLFAERLTFSYRDAVNNTSADLTAGRISVEIAGALADMIIPEVELDDVELSYEDGAIQANANVGMMRMTADGVITDLNINDISVNNTTASYTTDGSPLEIEIETFSLDDDGVLDLVAVYAGQDVRANGQIAPIARLIARSDDFPAKLAFEGFGVTAETDLVVNLSGDRPSASGTISIPEFTFADSAAGEGESVGSAAEKVFPPTPIPWDTLAVANADVAIDIAKVVLSNGLELSDIVCAHQVIREQIIGGSNISVTGRRISFRCARNGRDQHVCVIARKYFRPKRGERFQSDATNRPHRRRTVGSSD